MKQQIASKILAAVYVLLTVPTVTSTINDDAASKGSPPPGPSWVPGATAGERGIAIVAFAAGASYFVGVVGVKIVDVIVTGKKRWREADAGTDHQKWDDCERARRQLEETINRKDRELATCWTTIAEKDKQIAEKDKQIDSMTLQVNNLLTLNSQLASTIGSNNKHLIEHLSSKDAAKADPKPIEVAIAPGSQPIAVHEVSPAGQEGGAA